MATLAVRHLELSVKNDPTDPASHYHLGMAYVQAGAPDKARPELKRALAFNKNFDGIDEAKKTLAQIGG
jgi:Flp pilus assembly protein TadD